MGETPKIADELKNMQREEILPVEKKLVAWSLILGIVLLGILVWIGRAYFPAG
ncbi:MAG: hypothetical protein NTW86_11450 [Candidatus Sumerlaeota bacterium]|nr:hypothetical protein [Candidatus Sumerlaeota bacterium]